MIKVLIGLTIIALSVSALDYELSIYDKDGKVRHLTEKKEDLSALESNNISRKSVSTTDEITCNEKLKIITTDKSVKVYSEVFGPLPMTVNVYNDMEEVVFTKINEDKMITNFTIPVVVLENDYKIEIVNAFEDKTFCKIVEK